MADATVVLGRFSPYHLGHHAQVMGALGQPGKIVIVIGSAFHARTPRDPFTWVERAAMIRVCLPEPDKARVSYVPVRDYYSEERWAQAVKTAVASAVPEARRVQLAPAGNENLECHFDWLPGWPHLEMHSGPSIDDKALLRVLLGGDGIEAALAALEPMLPPPMIGYLRAWSKLPHYESLVAEQRANEEDRRKWAGSPYEPTFTTVDCVVRAADHVLLVQRKNLPGKGLWALPGGFLDPRERLLASAIRELHEETGLGLHDAALRRRLKGVVVFDHPDRAMRARTITHAHCFELEDPKLPEVRGGDDAAHAKWVPVAELFSLT